MGGVVRAEPRQAARRENKVIPADALLGHVAASEFGDRLRVPAAVATVATVVRRFFRRRPPTVRWLVRTIIVDSINAMTLRWPRPHVTEECFEAVLPSLAHRDAAAAVLRIVSGVGLQAATPHHGPRVVLTGAGATVRAAAETRSLSLQASTAEHLAAQVILPNHRDRSAVTPTLPESMARMRPLDFLDYHQTSEPLVNQIRQTPVLHDRQVTQRLCPRP